MYMRISKVLTKLLTVLKTKLDSKQASKQHFKKILYNKGSPKRRGFYCVNSHFNNKVRGWDRKLQIAT